MRKARLHSHGTTTSWRTPRLISPFLLEWFWFKAHRHLKSIYAPARHLLRHWLALYNFQNDSTNIFSSIFSPRPFYAIHTYLVWNSFNSVALKEVFVKLLTNFFSYNRCALTTTQCPTMNSSPPKWRKRWSNASRAIRRWNSRSVSVTIRADRSSLEKMRPSEERSWRWSSSFIILLCDVCDRIISIILYCICPISVDL